MLMAVDLRPKKDDSSPIDISLSTNVFVEVTPTAPKTHQVTLYLRLHHDIFSEQPSIDIPDLCKHCQISAVELDDLIEKKSHDYQIIRDGNKVGFVNYDAFSELVDSILVHLNADTQRAMGDIRAEDILKNQQNEIKSQYTNVSMINFGL